MNERSNEDLRQYYQQLSKYPTEPSFDELTVGHKRNLEESLGFAAWRAAKSIKGLKEAIEKLKPIQATDPITCAVIMYIAIALLIIFDILLTFNRGVGL